MLLKPARVFFVVIIIIAAAAAVSWLPARLERKEVLARAVKGFFFMDSLNMQELHSTRTTPSSRSGGDSNRGVGEQLLQCFQMAPFPVVKSIDPLPCNQEGLRVAA